MNTNKELKGCNNHTVRLGYPCPQCGKDGSEVVSPDWEQNRKNKQMPLAPKKEADTESFGDPQ